MSRNLSCELEERNPLRLEDRFAQCFETFYRSREARIPREQEIIDKRILMMSNIVRILDVGGNDTFHLRRDAY